MNKDEEYDNLNINQLLENGNNNNNNMKIFGKLNNNQLIIKDIDINNKIYLETNKIYAYLMESIYRFHQIFQNGLLNFEDSLKYLEKIAIPNKCVCAGVIESIPGWKCVECCKYENAIYCSDCFKKSKHLHKNHKTYFLYSSGGMCDCGDPDSLNIFCPEHSGPYSNKNQINDYISKTFNKDILQRLITFFDKLFYAFSKYFILTEKNELFYSELFIEKFENINDNNNNYNDLLNLKNDIILLKSNFCVVFQNLINFLRLISQKNLGMLHLLSIYFLKNHLEGQTLEESYYTKHRCINIGENDINILHTDNKDHICKCPFLSLLLKNWREEIKSINNENEEFLLSFPHNLPLRYAFCIIFFFLYKQILLNNNSDVLYNRNQFFSEDSLILIAKKTTLIEESYDFFYEYFKKYISSSNTFGLINSQKLNILKKEISFMENDTKYYSKPKMRKIMDNKICIIKRMIDCFCLIQNMLEFKSIVPHPHFQQKKLSTELIEIELGLLGIMEGINLYIQWEKIKELKEIFRYIINKITNQEYEGIKTLKDNEFSFHFCLYRCFGLLINAFCFNFAFKNKSSLLNSIEYFKQTFFNSKNEVEILVNRILPDYFRLFGFIAAVKNEFFNYYENLNNYNYFYFNDKKLLKMDFTLLKYILAMTEKNIDINNYLRISNIENVYSSFNTIFLSNNLPFQQNKENNNSMECEEVNDINNFNINYKDYQLNSFTWNAVMTLNNSSQQRVQNPIKNNSPNNSTNNNNKRLMDSDEVHCIMQWRFLLELLITFMKDDSSPYWTLMRFYEEAVSSQTKLELFNIIKGNPSAYQDLKNIITEKIILEMTAENNYVELMNLKQNIDKYLIILFDEYEFNKIIEELTCSKTDKETKIFYLKDSYLNCLDINYYFSPIKKSRAQRYIFDFKKDVVKSYNTYFYNPSKLTFEFFKTAYEKILLDKNNMELIIKIIEKFSTNQNDEKNLKFDIKSIKSSLLPIILNYLSIFSIINTKTFIKFKIDNKDKINYLSDLLSNIIKNNKNNKNDEILNNDLIENIEEIINQLNYFDIIYNDLNGNLLKLNEYDYNTKYIDNLKARQKNNNIKEANSINIISDNNINMIKKSKSSELREKLRASMKKKNKLFLNKAKSTDLFVHEIEQQDKSVENENNENDEIMCFYCRNQIQLNSFQSSYGKTGLLIQDFFYINTIKSTVKRELSKVIDKEDIRSNIYNNIFNKKHNENTDKLGRILSCGHFFHASCFKKGCEENYRKTFTCSVCLKNQNVLIPPLNNFIEKYSFFKSGKIEDLFYGIEAQEIVNNEQCALFNDIIFNFLKTINILGDNNQNINNYELFLQNIFTNFRGYFNFLENVFYIDGSAFHKLNQIYIMQNIILSLRYLVHINYINKKQIVNYIKSTLSDLIRGSSITEKIISNYKNMHYTNLFEKILLSLSILFDYSELKNTFKYIIYIFLPYFSFGVYLRHLIVNNCSFKEIYIDDFINHMKNNNKQMMNYFHSFLQKLSIIKIITDFNNKNDEIINSFNELLMDKLLSLLNIEHLYKLIKNEQNEINYLDILDSLPHLFNDNDIFSNLYKNDFDYIKIFLSLIINSKITKIDRNITKELIISFTKLKFGFIHLDDNIFDWIEKTLEKKCIICSKTTKYDYICLICGNKVCHTRSCNNYYEHLVKCCGDSCLYIDMDNMKALIVNLRSLKYCFPLYINKNGDGPSGYEIGNEYNLSHEKIKLAIKNYVCNDFLFN